MKTITPKGLQSIPMVRPTSPLTFLAVCFDGNQEMFLAVKATSSSDARLKVEAKFLSEGNDPSKARIDIHLVQPVRDIQVISYHNFKIDRW